MAKREATASEVVPFPQVERLPLAHGFVALLTMSDEDRPAPKTSREHNGATCPCAECRRKRGEA